MYSSRRLVAALAVAAFSVGVAGCAQQVAGTPVAGAAGKATDSSSEKKTSGSRPSTGSSASPRTSSGSTPGGSTGDVTVATRKATDGYDVCTVLSKDELQQVVGGTLTGEPPPGFCILQTKDPYQVLSVMVTILENNTNGEQITVSGNTAYQVVDEDGACDIDVLLTDDPDAIINTLNVSLAIISGGGDSCEGAQKLAEAVFAKLPNA
jgi:hypothetical protein